MATVVITYDGNNITNSVVFARTSFEQSFNATPGSFNVLVRDPDQTLSFETGQELTLEVDGVRMFGGFVRQVSMTHLAPAADTSDLGTYQLRAWQLRGTDYNIMFDARVVRNTANFLEYISMSHAQDGDELIDLVENYADMSDFSTAGIQNIANIPGGEDVIQQGTKLRQWFQNLSFFGGAVWYIDGSKTIVYKPFEDAEKRWGFSDQPNGNAITVSPNEYQGATRGFRQVEAIEDGSYMVNDALIWGGSEFAGTAGGTVFAREQDATSITNHYRWQVAETHFGERYYKTQAGVDARASVIINGPPGADIYGQQKGLKNPQWQFNFTWFAEDVPDLSGTPDHLVPGDIVTIEMNVFGVTRVLPLRNLRTTFPVVDGNDATVQFDGTFGLQLSDPFTLWRYLILQQNQVRVATPTIVTETSTTTVFGATFQGEPTPLPNGSETVFSIGFGYISGSLQVFMGDPAIPQGGVLLQPGTEYTESDNETGEFTMTTAPSATAWLYCIAATLDS